MSPGRFAPRRPLADRRPLRHRGFTYLGVLFLVVAFGIGLASVAVVWRTSMQREKETELLFVGKQYRQAIASYYASGQREFPARLEDLLLDPRFPGVKRHLRRLYRDPMTGAADWGLVKQGARIVGVYSLAQGTPLREVASGALDEPPMGGKSYSDWKFVVDARTQGQAAVRPGQPPGAIPTLEPEMVPLQPGMTPLQPVESANQPVASDLCEQEQALAIGECQGDDPAGNPEFQTCVAVALQQYQQCKGGQ